MKKSILILGTAILLIAGIGLLTGCCANGNKKTKTEKTVTAEKYQCPMKCEGEKTYSKPGKCPVCGMKLKKVEKTKNGDN